MTARPGGPILQALLCAALVVLFYLPFITTTHFQTGGDAANLFWPLRAELKQSLFSEGRVLLWSHYSFLGHPVLATLQHAVLYLPEYLFLFLFPAHLAIQANILLHLILIAVGVFAFLRLVTPINGWVAALLAATYPCTAWFWGHTEHINQLAAVAWVPWILVLMELARRGLLHLPIAVGLLAIAVSFLLHAGHPQEAIYGLFFAVLLGFRHAIGNATIRSVRPLAVLLAGSLLGGMMAAPVFLPAAELSQSVTRLVPDIVFAQSFSMPPQNLITLLLPVLKTPTDVGPQEFLGLPILRSGEYGVFLGQPLLLLILAGSALTVWRGEQRFYLVAGIFFLLLAMGGNTNPERLVSLNFEEFTAERLSVYGLLCLIPPFESFRVPARFLFLAIFCGIILAAQALANIEGNRPRFAVPLAVLILAVNGAILYVVSQQESFRRQASVEFALRLAAEDRAHHAGDTVFRLTIGDDAHLFDRRLRDPAAEPLAARVHRLHPHSNVLSGIRVLGGYEEGLLPTDDTRTFLNRFNRNLRQFQPDTTLLSLLGINYVWAELPIDTDRFPLAEQQLSVPRTLHRNTGFVGQMFLESQLPEGMLSALENKERLTVPNQEAVALPPLPEGWSAPAGGATVERIRNQIRVTIPSGEAGILVLPRERNWKSDEGPLKFPTPFHARIPANAIGEATLLRYEPQSYRTGLFFAVLGMLATSFLFAVGRTKAEAA